MKKNKKIIILMIHIFFIKMISPQPSSLFTASDIIELVKAFDKQKKILLTVNDLKPEQMPSKQLKDSYKQQETLVKKFENAKNSTALQIINDKTKELYNTIPHIEKAIQKITGMLPATKISSLIHQPLQTSPTLLIEAQKEAPLTLVTKTQASINNPSIIAPAEQLDVQKILTPAVKTTTPQAEPLQASLQLLLQQDQPISMNELKEKFAALEKTFTQEFKNIPTKPSALVQTPSPAFVVQKKENQKLQERLSQLEVELYKKFYYNYVKELLTKDGIKDIIKTLHKEQPTLTDAQLIQASHEKAINLVLSIKKQNKLDAQSKLLLLQMINEELDARNEKKNTVQKAPIFTPALKELSVKRPLTEYEDITPTSFTSTTTFLVDPVKATPQTNINTEQQSAEKLPANLMQFVEYSKKQAGNYYYSRGAIAQNWLLNAVGHILNGMFTGNKKEDVTQKLFTMIDILIAEPLRSDTSITDDEYAKIVARLEDQIKKFVDTLVIDKIYRPSK